MAKTKVVSELVNNYTLAVSIFSCNMGIYPANATAASACNRAVTISGLRWNISHITGAAVANAHLMKWCIWVRRGSQTLPNLAFGASPAAISTAFSTINPNDILVWGSGHAADQSDYPRIYDGATKTQRKMNEGDELVFSAGVIGNGTETGQIYATIQTFLKS